MAIRIYEAGEHPPVENLTVLIYGEPRIGKSTLARTASNPLVLNFGPEPDAKVSSDSVLSVRRWSDADIAIVREKSDQFDSVIVDSLERAQRVLIQQLTSDAPELLRAGRLTLDGYGALLNSFMAWVIDIKGLKKDIVTVVNSRTSLNRVPSGRYFEKHEIGLQGSSRNQVPTYTDLIGRVYFNEDKQRMLAFESSASTLGKNPRGALKTAALPPIDKIDGYLATLIQKSKDAMNSHKE